jgi:hypothetical protein
MAKDSGKQVDVLVRQRNSNYEAAKSNVAQRGRDLADARQRMASNDRVDRARISDANTANTRARQAQRNDTIRSVRNVQSGVRSKNPGNEYN